MARSITIFLVWIIAVTAGAQERLIIPQFVNSGGFSASLTIHNHRIDRATTFRAFVMQRGAAQLIGEGKLEPRETRSYTVADSGEGAIQIEHDGGRHAMSASASMRYAHSELSLKVGAIDPARIAGTRFAALIWNPAPGTRAEVALVNTATNTRRVRVSFGPRLLSGLTIEPQQRIVLDVAELLARGGEPMRAPGAIALELQHDGEAGDVVAAGHAIHVGERYASSIAFADLAHGMHDQKLRSGFAFLGAPPRSYRFEHGTSFRSFCSVYNATAAHKQAVVRWTTVNTATSVVIDSFELAPYETRTLDLVGLQSRGIIPRDAHHGFIEVAYEGDGRAVALLTNLDDSPRAYRYNIASRMTGELSKIVATDYWESDGYSTTLVAAANAASFPDTLTFESWNGGSRRILGAVTLGAGERRLIDLRSWAGAEGSGTLTVRGKHGLRSAFYFEQLLINASPLEPPQLSVHMSDLDSGNDMRPNSLTLESEPPPGVDDDDATSINLVIYSFVRYSDGSYVNEPGAVELVSDSPQLTVETWGANATLVLPSEGTAWEGAIFGGFHDSCSSMYFTHVITFKNTYSAYAYAGQTAAGCLWRATCSGSCPGAIDHYSTTNQFGTCFTGTRTFKQCWDFWINDSCTPRIICKGRTGPGGCS